MSDEFRIPDSSLIPLTDVGLTSRLTRLKIELERGVAELRIRKKELRRVRKRAEDRYKERVKAEQKKAK